VTLTPTLAADRGDLVFTGNAFELGAAQSGISLPGFTFNSPVTVTLQYSDAGLRPVDDEGQLALSVWMEAGWMDAAQTCDPTSPAILSSEANTLIVRICQAGKFALFGPTERVFLPYVSRIGP
jgi:hypothetical protein